MPQFLIIWLNCFSKGNYSESESLFRKALHIKEKILGKDHFDTVKTLYNLAEVLGEKVIMRVQNYYFENTYD